MKRLLIVVLVAGAGLTAAGPARAETTCGPARNVEIATPGFDTDLSVTLCVTHGALTRGAYPVVSWKDGGGGNIDGDRKFDSLVVHYRVQSAGRELDQARCSIADRVNRDEKGTHACKTIYLGSTPAGGWNAVGSVEYNVDRDGDGVKTIELSGSPVVQP